MFHVIKKSEKLINRPACCSEPAYLCIKCVNRFIPSLITIHVYKYKPGQPL